MCCWDEVHRTLFPPPALQPPSSLAECNIETAGKEQQCSFAVHHKGEHRRSSLELRDSIFFFFLMNLTAPGLS